MTRIAVPDQLVAVYTEYGEEAGVAWVAGLPDLAAEFLKRWELAPDGPTTHGTGALVVPVRRADGAPAALKLQHVTEETATEPVALRQWAGNGAVRLLEHDEPSGTMLLERLDPRRSLASVPDHQAALLTLAGLLAKLSAIPAPAGLRTVANLADRMLAETDGDSLAKLRDEAGRRVLDSCAAALREVRDQPGDRLLHWDLHYANVLASLPGSGRDPWLAIDPKPLAGDPGFDLLPALWNRWDDVLSTGDVARAVNRRFDLLTEVAQIDRQRGLRWTLARVLQNALWDLRRGNDTLQPEHVAIAETLLSRLGG